MLCVSLWAITVCLLLLSLSFGKWYELWPLEIIGAGYLWFAALTLILLLALLLLRSYGKSSLPHYHKLMCVTALALGVYGTTIGTWYVPRLHNTKIGGSSLQVMTYNVNYKLWNTDAVTNIVRANPVDVFGLVEPFREQAAELRDNVQDLYPYYYRATGGGLSLFSAYPIFKTTTENLGTRYHSLFATIDVQGKPVQVVVAHPLAPVSQANFVDRNEAMVALANYGAQQSITTIIMGDFNVTPWSIFFRNFTRNSGLRSANLGHGLHSTWFYNDIGRSLSHLEWVKQLLKIPIDHIFVSANITVDQVSTLSAGVSDHRPVLAKLRVQ